MNKPLTLSLTVSLKSVKSVYEHSAGRQRPLMSYKGMCVRLNDRVEYVAHSPIVP